MYENTCYHNLHRSVLLHSFLRGSNAPSQLLLLQLRLVPLLHKAIKVSIRNEKMNTMKECINCKHRKYVNRNIIGCHLAFAAH